jgi:hypothetical protein
MAAPLKGGGMLSTTYVFRALPGMESAAATCTTSGCALMWTCPIPG